MFYKEIARLVKIVLRRFRSIKSGQIRKEHQIGRWIEFISAMPNVNNMVEIGTWNGRGSSQAIVRGVKSRSRVSRADVNVIGYEINPLMVKSAEKVLKKYSFFKVIFGSIVNVEELDRTNLDATEKSWFEQDVLWMANAPKVFETLPSSIDLLILDGGEFSTFAEFVKLNSRVTNWIILDDTKTRKCAEIMRLVRKENKFFVVYESDERHGTSILKRIG
jgi:hypothetical protein